MRELNLLLLAADVRETGNGFDLKDPVGVPLEKNFMVLPDKVQVRGCVCREEAIWWAG